MQLELESFSHFNPLKKLRMKKYIVLFIAFMIAQSNVIGQEDFRSKSPKPGPAPVIKLGDSKQVTLKNGLKVIVVENHKLPQISFRLFVDVPPVLEGPSMGYIDIAGQMLNKGTATKSKADIDEAVDFIGASLSTSYTGISGTCLTKHKDQLLELMTDVLFNPSFPEDEFKKLKTQAISTLAQAKDDPNQIASNVSSRLNYGRNHPYGEVSTDATIKAIELKECKKFYETYFQPGISYLLITGDIATQEALNLASKYFADWENTPIVRQPLETPQKPEATTVNFVDKPGAVQSVINVTFPIEIKPGAPDAIKASVMNTALGAYFGSRLMSNLREDKAFTYGARSILSTDKEIGYFNAYASVRNEVTDSAVVEFLREIERLREEEMPEDELQMVKNYRMGSFARSLENPGTVANYTLNTARYGLSKDYYATYLEKLNAVTTKDVLAMAKKYLTTDRANIVVVGNKDEVADKLLPFSKQGRVNYYDVFGNIVEEISMEVPAGITADIVIEDYLNSIGGLKKLNAVENIIIVMSAEIQGMTLESILYHAAPNKLSMTNKMLGNIVQQSIFDGEKGISVSMGQSEVMEGDRLADMKIDGRIIPERFYKGLGVTSTLKGIELVNGKKAYRIDLLYPSGKKKVNYFDMESNLKIREIDYEGEFVITNEIGDYKEVNGIKLPHSVTVTGAMPVPLELKTTTVEVNTEISEEIFKVE